MSGREEQHRQIEYMVTCIGDFAAQHAMTPAVAYAFLEKYKGLSFLIDCYDVEHTQSIQTAVDDMYEVCVRNGGGWHDSVTEAAVAQSHGDCVHVALLHEATGSGNRTVP